MLLLLPSSQSLPLDLWRIFVSPSQGYPWSFFLSACKKERKEGEKKTSAQILFKDVHALNTMWGGCVSSWIPQSSWVFGLGHCPTNEMEVESFFSNFTKKKKKGKSCWSLWIRQGRQASLPQTSLWLSRLGPMICMQVYTTSMGSKDIISIT